MISIVCPAYNEAQSLSNLIQAVSAEMTNEDYELIIVDDGSTDETVDVLLELRVKYKQLKFISFGRNFGHQSALLAGIQHATGNCLIMLDADLQHPPTLFPSMIKEWKRGYNIVQCIREDSKTNFKTLSSRLFYKIVSYFSDTDILPGTSDFRLIDKKVVDNLKKLQGPVFLRGHLPWTGYSTFNLYYTPDSRKIGESKFTFKKMVKLSIEGITMQTVLPLKIARDIGALISSLAFIYAIYALYVHLFSVNTVPGWTSLLISVLFLGGVQLICVGVLGEYVGRIFERSQNKPNYVEKQKEGFDE